MSALVLSQNIKKAAKSGCGINFAFIKSGAQTSFPSGA